MSRATLRVWLHDIPVGELSLTDSDGSEFRLYETYRERYPRPVLGQHFLDDLHQVHRVRNRAPAWFSNLLPEGPLRDFIAERAGVHTSREFFLLRHLGDDLPGAVRVVCDAADPEPSAPLRDLASDGSEEREWRFSLAGVQLKFSARQEQRGLTVPVSGVGGDWIIKLPDPRLTEVPRVELATLRWARTSGIDVPETRLVPIHEIHGLPASARQTSETHALAIHRFDRPKSGPRIHIEDFAQVFGVFPEQKYQRVNYDTLAHFIYAAIGADALDDFVRRLLFVIASGNGDAHLKNWSLIYPDGHTAQLAPAYDQVATALYLPDEKLALNLNGNKDWRCIDSSTFERLARRIGTDPNHIRASVRNAVDAIAHAWRDSASDFGFTKIEQQRLESHMQRIPIFQTRTAYHRSDS